MEHLTVALSKPIEAHGEVKESLAFREPNAGDLMECGYPLEMAEGGASPKASVIAKYIARLGQIPPSSVKAMSIADFNACMGIILSFFGK